MESKVEYLFTTDTDDAFIGVVRALDLRTADPNAEVATLAHMPHVVHSRDDLRTAAWELARGPANVPVVVVEDGTVVGLLTSAGILKAYGHRMDERSEDDASILLHRRRLKVMAQSKQLYRKLLRKG